MIKTDKNGMAWSKDVLISIDICEREFSNSYILARIGIIRRNNK